MGKTAHLAALLGAYQPTTDDERRFLDAMLGLLASGDRAFDREHYAPGHFTASAFVLDGPRASLLLILHGKLGMWLQPGGHVDPEDADVVAAARRELREEVGLVDATLIHDGIFDIDVHHIPARGAAPAHRHFDVRFLFTANTAELSAASDAADARWVPLAEVSRTQSDASVMRAVERLRR